MISVLLADDNKIALHHFANLIDWESLGFRLAGVALNGIEAFRKFEQLKPELVITDVQMPGMDGRELAQRILSVSPETMIIFLSSYDEFDYARAAIDLNIHDYILKQELDRQLMTKKLTAIRALMENRNAQSYELLDRQLYLYFHTASEDVDIILSRSDASDYGNFRFFVLEQDHIPDPVARLTGRQIEETDYQTIIPAILAKSPADLHLVRFAPYRWVSLQAASTASQETAQQTKAIAEIISGCSFTLYVFPACGTLLDCRLQYEKKRFLFEQKYFEHPSATLYTELYESPVSVSPSIATLSENPEARDHQLQNMVMAYDYEGIMQAICSGITALETKLIEHKLPIALFDEETIQLLTVRRCIRWLKMKTQMLNEALNSAYSEPINKAILYISQHYDDPLLGLEDIAAASCISVNRLNEAFKKELHQTVGRYLTSVRMEKARELLSKPNMRILDAARLTGYSSPSYFAHVFGKTWGTTPQAFQKNHTKKSWRDAP